MPDPNRRGLPKRNEMTASLWDKKHSPYLVKNIGDGDGEHFIRKEVHVVGTGEPTEDTILQVHQIECYRGDGDVVAFFLEQVQGEFFRKYLPGGGGTGYAMNRCVSGVVRDPAGLAKHANGILVVLDPLPLLKDGSVGISNQQSPNNMIDIKQNLPKCIKLLRCTTMRYSSYGGGVKSPRPFVISTALNPTSASTVHITRTHTEMCTLVGGNVHGLSCQTIGDGKLVINQGQGLPNIFAIPYRISLNLTHMPGDTPQLDIKLLIEQRNTSGDCPILITTSEDPNESVITITKNTLHAKTLVKGLLVNSISQDKLQAGPMLVLDWTEKGITIYAHAYDDEITIGKPGEIFNKSIYNALLAREATLGQGSKGAISVFRNEQDAKNHLPIITGPSWSSSRSGQASLDRAIGVGGRNNPKVKAAEAIAGKAFPCTIGNVYTRGHESEDGHVDKKALTLFLPQATKHFPNLADRLKKYPDTLCVGKTESQSDPELLHEPEQPPAASVTPPPTGLSARATRASKRRSTAASSGENEQPNSPQKSSRSRRRT